MAFENYLCWSKDRAFTVMNPDAEHVSDEIFRAVHTEHPLTLVDANPETRKRWSELRRWIMDPHVFLKDFLLPARAHVQAGVLGESGSGKSHFIHWMALNIPDDESQYKLSIPKAGTSLRGVLDRMVAVLPEDRRQVYGERLDQAGYQNENHEQRKKRLLAMIALAIGGDHPQGNSNVDEETWLIEGLPSVFQDPHLLSYLSAEGGIVDELVKHIMDAPAAYSPVEQPRAFVPEDLRLGGVDLAKMSKEGRDTLAQLSGDSELLDIAIGVINRNLNRAIGQVLNFTGDQLLELMTEIRRYLYREGKGLILLIEDFARLQGVDGALLQALIEAPGSGKDALCDMRWAMAVTRGYYDKMANTIQTRMDYLIDMDLPTEGDQAIVNADRIVDFSSRYLNASRSTVDELDQWHERFARAGDQERPPNRCVTCPYREPCHNTFGASEEVGLYPFTRSALSNMADRKAVTQNNRFNPRRLIKEVLAEVTGNRADDLANGRFPTEDLLDFMGGPELAPLVRQTLQQADGHNFRRQLAVLELWSSSPGVPSELAPGIYKAFSVPRPDLGHLGDAPPPAQEISSEGSLAPSALEQRVELVRAWGRGGAMPERLAGDLRDSIYRALETYIDWDQEGLGRSAFAGRTEPKSPFRNRSIAFHKQQTQIGQTPVRLNVGADGSPDELTVVAIALEGLLRFDAVGHWEYPNGQRMLIALATCMERWAADLVDQFKRLPDKKGQWTPVAAAVELLAVGSALGGRTGANLAEHLSNLFGKWPPEAPAQAEEWKRLYSWILAKQPELISIVRAWASGGKGGQALSGFLDPSKIVEPLIEVRKNWELVAGPAKSVDPGHELYRNLVQWHEKLADDLTAAAESELKAKCEWIGAVRECMAENESRKDLVQAIEGLLGDINDHGVACDRRVLRQFDELLPEFRSVPFDKEVARVARLLDDTEPRRRLGDLVRTGGDHAIDISIKFLRAVAELVEEVGEAIDSARPSQSVDDSRAPEILIGSELRSLVSALDTLEGRSAG